MGLTEYNRKRDFKKTAEPKGKEKKHTGKNSSGKFVIQKHAASRLHYDFRLEIDGVLKSWAVPKGPSLNPKDKRLAMMVEDHPVDYGDFEGIIPENEYGGGTVMLWDHGTWESLDKGADMLHQLKAGSMKFRLKGKRLQGAWALVHIKGGKYGKSENSWLLIKERDDKATDATPVTEKYTTSVTTRRAMGDIAAGKPTKSRAKESEGNGGIRVWKSNRAAAADTEPLDPSKVDGAKKSSMPQSLKPQLATLVKSAPETDRWVHEIKFDGYRFLAFIKQGKVTLITRNGKDWTTKFSSIAESLARLPVDAAIVDGELVAMDDQGVTRFQLLQNSLKGEANPALAFYAFDLVYLNGYNLKGATLDNRKNLLRQLLQTYPDNDIVRFSEHFAESGEKVWDNACRMGLEGIISKCLTSKYVEKRSDQWVKVKCSNRQEFIIGGYTKPSGSRQGFGALLVGFHNEKGNLRYAGKVGTGFTDATLKDMHAQMQKIERKTPPFENPPKGAWTRGIHWLEPKLIAEVAFTEMTDEGLLRHPSFQGLREDKKPEAITVELPQPEPDEKTPEAKPAKKASKSRGGTETPVRHSKKNSEATAKKAAQPSKTKPAAKTSKTPKPSTPKDTDTSEEVKLTNPQRVLFPDDKYTKQDLADYYAAIQDRAFYWMHNRPITLVRCPEGRTNPCFYQRHNKIGNIAGVEPVEVKIKNSKEIYLQLANPIGLRALVQNSTLEIHGWQCRADDVEHPDRIVFDVDPSPEVEWKDIIAAARTIKSLLEKCGFTTFPMTTGGKGLHVVVPLKPAADWDAVIGFAEAIARFLEATHPDNYTANMSKKKRVGKVFVDYLRNNKTASAILPYSSRARAGATVATPITWDELTAKLDPSKFNIKTVPKRVASQKKDPWADFDKARKPLDFEKVIGKLQKQNG